MVTRDAANPTLKLTDIEAIAAITRPAGLLLVVDNTFLTPLLLRPLDLRRGHHLALDHSSKATTLRSAACVPRGTERSIDRLRLIRKTLGSIQSPHEAWLTARGIATLPLRLQRRYRGAQLLPNGWSGIPISPGSIIPALPLPSVSWRSGSMPCTAAACPSSCGGRTRALL